MALTQQQIDEARNWINTQWGGNFDYANGGTYSPYDATTGAGSAFNEGGGGSYDPSNMQRNWGVLGAGQAMGYGADDLSQILGQTAGDITAMQQQYQPQVDINASLFRHDNPGVGAAAPTPAAGQPAAPSPGAGAYGGFDGGPAPTLNQGYTPNPYLDQIAQGLTTQSNNNLMRNILPGIRGGAVAAGGVGGSRQGLAEGQAIGDAQTGLNGALGSLYGTDFQGSQNRNLQQYGMDQNYGLGRSGQALTNQGQQMNFYTAQRGQDQSGAALGANLYGLGTQGAWSPLTQASGIYDNYTGFGNTTTSGTQGGGAQGLLGGALTGASFGRQMKWW